MSKTNVQQVPDKYFTLSQQSEAEENIQDTQPVSLSFYRDSWRRIKKNKGAVVSLIILLIILVIAVGSIWFSPHNPDTQQVQYSFLPPKIPGLHINGFNGYAKQAGVWVDVYKEKDVPSSVYFYLGTDQFGRDLLSRLLYGTRISLLIAFSAAFLDLTIGVPYGLISGWLGGKADTIMQRALEIISGVPTLVVVVLMLLIFPPGIPSIIMALALIGWITMARVVRGQTLQIKNQEFILAARVLGQRPVKTVLGHILPNLSSVIIIQTMFTIPEAIFFEAFLSFIGVGMRAPNASLGTLINDGYQTFQFYPHLMWYPALIISLIMIAFNIFADGLRDAFDPKMKG
ncbi:ABC transporter permease [Sporolactobacillus shoreae]|uniref:ABC transporter permease n=1 Tax=Sporolactobacillus shoreae TaxID=1465501 RepID=A0A4Z0GPQ5_9BACL|nr:ABC transporter permease [Sporolactobacillus shoreae]TGA98978.1 ABC transporter permease [Sporolactobacillus shoreae]